MPDAVKPLRQYVDQEAADELVGLHGRRLVAVAVPVIVPTDADLAAVINSVLGMAMRLARPAIPSKRMVSQVTSSSHQAWPWRAERGSAWWLLCHPSPLLM